LSSLNRQSLLLMCSKRLQHRLYLESNHLLDKDCPWVVGIEEVCKLPHRNGGII